eukprot:9663595-Alexandrium_andersonii.AAC.1
MTPGCPGCISANRNGPARAHTEACRARMEGRMLDTRDERMDRYAKRVAEEMEEEILREARRKAPRE